MKLKTEFFANEGQYRFFQSTAKYRLALTGVGGGKSVAGAIESLRLACTNQAVPAFVIAPTYDMLRLNTVPPIKKFWPAEFIENPSALSTKTGPFDIKLKNGTVIHFRSGENPDNLRGPNIGWAWIDEAGMMERYAWDILLGRIRVNCPRDGAILTTTPKGMNWLYDLFEANRPSEDYETIRWAAKQNETNLRPGFYNDLKKSLHPLLIRQEVDGEYVNINASSYLNYSDVVACESDKLPMMPKQADSRLYLGVDIGRKHDLTVIVALFQMGDTYYTAALKKIKGAPYGEQKQAIKQFMPMCRMCCIDETGIGSQLSEELENEYGSIVQPVTFTASTKEDIAASLRRLLETQRIRIPKDSSLRSDLLAVENQVSDKGVIRLVASRTEDGHADQFWAYALAARAVGNAGEMVPVIFA